MDERALEAAASALRDHTLNRDGRGKPWEDLREEIKERWRVEARIVIETYERVMS